LLLFFSLFFFQAEDGIRDFHVTGVQTCALPICTAPTRTRRGSSRGSCRCGPRRGPRSFRWRPQEVRPLALRRSLVLRPSWLSFEIGRASCRERLGITVVGDAEC